MKKGLVMMVTMLLAASMGVGCGSSEVSNNDVASQTGDVAATGESVEITSDPVELTVWESTLGPDEFIKQAGAKFTEEYPNITINYVNVEVGDTAKQIALDGPAGIGPDVFAAPHDKLGELVAGGHILPTQNADEVSQNLLASCTSAVTYDDKMYGYPVSAETYALFYNKALISEDEVPTTWEDLKSFAEKFNSENSGKYAFMMDVEAGYYTIIFTTAQNNRLFGEDGTDTTNTNINSEASIKGMEFFQSLRSILDVPAADLVTSSCDAAFGNGNVALYITGLWNVANFESQGLEFGVVPLPSLPGDDTPAASFAGTRSMFVSAYTDYPNEAALFAKFLESEEMQQLRFDLTGALPAINCEVESPYIEGFMKQLEYAFPMPSIPQMNAYWDAMNAASANIWDGADVKTELDSCNATILAQ